MSDLELIVLEGDTSRFVDRRIGLSLCIPGHPERRAIAPSMGVSEPTYEALIALADVPVTLRYRHDEQPVKPANLAVLAEAYAANRCKREDLQRAQPASADQCRVWGADAAASTIYPLREPDGDGDNMEEALLVARGMSVVTITKRFSRERTSWVSWTLANSAIAAGLRWDPAALDTRPAPLWPHSTFLAPGVTGTLVAKRRDAATRIGALVAARPSSAVRLGDGIAALVRGGEPPSHVVTAQERTLFDTYLGDLTNDPDLGRELSALVADVQTAHDLRGLCLLVLHALGKIRATFAASSEDDRRAFDHLTE